MPDVTFCRSLYIKQAVILLSGLVAGFAAAYWILSLPIPFGGDLEVARAAGIVSLTTINGYSKQRDLFQYAVIMILPVAMALVGWSVWAAAQPKHLLRTFWEEQSDNGSPRKLIFWMVLTATLLISFNASSLLRPNSGWELLGEEGLTLAWAQSILNQGVLSKDFSGGYAPLLIYPLAVFMKLFDASILSQRIYAYLLNMTAYGLIIAILFSTVRSRLIAIVAAITFVAVFSPFAYLALNKSYLRVVLGILPLYLGYRFGGRLTAGKSLLVGAMLGMSILFSQEVGICSAVAFLVMTALQFQGSLRTLLGKAAWILSGIAVPVIPFLAYFTANGAGASFLHEFYLYPKLYAAGYSALPFPDFRKFIFDPFNPAFFYHFGVIFIYIIVSVRFIPRLLTGVRSNRSIYVVSLMVFGALLYRSALCRSDLYHVFYVSPPAIMLVFMLIDQAVSDMKQYPRWMRLPEILFAGMLVFLLAVLMVKTPIIRQLSFASLQQYGFSIKGRFKAENQGGFLLPELHRGRVFFDGATAADIHKVKSFLDTNLAENEPVYFFPNEAGYYFLFDRQNPTRFAFAYQAVTSAQRQEIVRDLATKNIRYIVYGVSTWRIDNIPETVQVPEVVDYIMQNYHSTENLGNIIIMRRNDS